MYSRLLVFCAVVLFAGMSKASVMPLSDKAEISVMTIGPYQGELYSAFGHSAIHVYDPESRLDLFYNYGVFDFDQENFYLNFAQGKMLYQLGVGKYRRFVEYYVGENRDIVEQVLNLSLEEKQQLVDYLNENYKPENREYYYNYVYDNCATKMHDVLVATFPDKVKFNEDFITDHDKTIRDLMDEYLAYQPWGDLIIDIGLGLQIDKKADPKEYMFLPDYMAAAFATATIDRDSVEVPLVKETVVVYKAEPEVYTNSILTPFNTFVILFFVVGFFTNRDFKKERRSKWIDPLVFFMPGFIGWWIVFLWFGTVHLSQNNLNILWAIPLHFPLIFFINKPRFQKILSTYFLVVSILYIALILGWSLLPQPLHMALIPLILTMILRGLYIHHDLKLQIRKRTRI